MSVRVLLVPLVVGCAVEEPLVATEFAGTSEKHCPDHKRAALEDNTKNFAKDFIRWECRDFAKAPKPRPYDFGQEYCEDSAVLALPGRAVRTFRGDKPGATANLSDAEVETLEKQSAQNVVGSCVFSTWFRDSTYKPASDLKLHGRSVDTDFRCEVGFNSRTAAADLWDYCERNVRLAGDLSLQACDAVADIFDTAFRRSDFTICTAAMGMARCGCTPTKESAVELPAEYSAGTREIFYDAPEWQAHGLPLGSWDDPNKLPTGCRPLIEIGDKSIAIACDLTASMVLKSLDMRQSCRDRYADKVVMHVPIERKEFSCRTGCTDAPWALGGKK